MPRYKGSCGCYNRQDARELGLAPAIVWNDMLDRSEHFDANPMWYDQRDAAERLGISERTMARAVDKLVEAGRISKKRGYRPKTTIQTTWVTILEGEECDGKFRNHDLANSETTDLADSILYETKKRDSLLEVAEEEDCEEEKEDVATILPLTQLLATISQLVRTHNRRNKEKLFFDKKKMEANYDRLKEKLEDAGLDFGKKEVEQVFKRALDSINEADSKANYLAGTNQVDVFFHPNNIQHFLLSGEVKEYDEVTTRAYNWIINNGYAKDVADIKAREDEIYKQVVDNEEYQRVLRGM